MAPVDGKKYEVVPGMALAIEARMAELKIDDVATLARTTGIARQILGHLLAGYRKGYKGGTTGPFCDAMEWERDGVKLLLQGKPPRPLRPAAPSSRDEVGQLRERVAELDLQVQDHARQLKELAAAMKPQQRPPRRSAGGSQ